MEVVGIRTRGLALVVGLMVAFTLAFSGNAWGQVTDPGGDLPTPGDGPTNPGGGGEGEIPGDGPTNPGGGSGGIPGNGGNGNGGANGGGGGNGGGGVAGGGLFAFGPGVAVGFGGVSIPSGTAGAGFAGGPTVVVNDSGFFGTPQVQTSF